MIKGITPIDAAFELIGLCNAQQLTHYIFFQTMGGALIFAVGFVFSLWAAVSKGTFKPFFTFLILFFSMWILFIVPTVQEPSVTSTMEQNGYSDITTSQVLSSSPTGSLSNNTGVINPILDTISNMLSAFTIGCVGAIELGGDPGKTNYLKSPFMVAKLSAISNQLVTQGFSNPQLSKEASDFYKNYYLPTLQNLIQQRAYTIANIPQLWPGDPAITALYTSDATTAWSKLQSDILTNLQQQSGITNKSIIDLLSSFTGKNSSVVQNQAIISLFKSDIRNHPSDYTSQSYQSSGYANSSNSSGRFWGNLMGNSLAAVGANIFQPIAVTISQAMLNMAPYIQGYSLMLMFSFFPFILVIVILERKPMLLVEFLKNLFWVKSWSICWAIVDLGSSYVLTIQQMLNKTDSGLVGFWDGAYFNIVTAVFMIMLPILSRMMIDGVATGIGVAATAANMHADKSVDLGVRTSTGAIGKIGPTIKAIKPDNIRPTSGSQAAGAVVRAAVRSTGP